MTKNISRSTEEKGHPTEALFSSPTMVALLEIFFLHPEEEFYQRQLESFTRKPLISIQRELKRLERAGLVEDFRDVARYFDRCRIKRHNVDYDRAGAVGKGEVEELIREAVFFRIGSWFAWGKPPGPLPGMIYAMVISAHL
jgi:hypothetical protein